MESEGAIEIVLEAIDDQLDVSVGDLVIYFNIDNPEIRLSVKITSLHTDFSQGLIGETTPLAQVLLGSTAGDEVVLRVPGKAAATLRIYEIIVRTCHRAKQFERRCFKVTTTLRPRDCSGADAWLKHQFDSLAFNLFRKQQSSRLKYDMH